MASALSLTGACAAMLLAHEAVATGRPVGQFSAGQRPIERANDSPRPGMTADEVRRALGPPDRVARQILHRRFIEQWCYEKRALWIDFAGSKGQEPRVVHVHGAGAGPP
jgi:hypothetical protein